VAHHGGTGWRTRQRRWQVVVAALVALVTAGCGGSSSSSPSPSPSSSSSPQPGPAPLKVIPTAPAVAGETHGTGSRSDVTGGALFGGNVSMLPEAALLGRRLAIVRDYYKLGARFPNPTDSRVMASGSTLLVSLDSPLGGPTYASIAAGYEDATVSAFLEALNRAAIRHHLAAIYFTFEHEPNARAQHVGLGSPAQFIQAWDHLHALAQSLHLNWTDGGRIHWVWILSYQTFIPLAQRTPRSLHGATAAEFWPGSTEVDVVAADGYEGYGCPRQPPGQVRTAGFLFGPVIRFAHQHGGLPVFITEWGATSFPAANWQALFIRQMQAFVTANPEIAAVFYWNSPGRHRDCNFSIDAHPASVAAMARIASSRALQGHLG
jgi:hypothetical protein